MNSSTQNTNSVVSLVGRILLAAIFLFSAYGKLMNPGGTQGYIASVGLPFPVLAYAAALAVELGAGILLLIGYRVRVATLLLAAFSVLSAFIFHHALADQNQLFHFLKNIAIAGGLLQVYAFGAGAYSIDNHIGSGRTKGLAAL